MDNNNNSEQIQKLEREIWLFQQWLKAVEGQEGETHKRIRTAYLECIESREAQLAILKGDVPMLDLEVI
jgi:predicted RNase H-like nuclease (RuvC/YqgF family)